MTTWRVLLGDVRETLASLPEASVQCCVTWGAGEARACSCDAPTRWISRDEWMRLERAGSVTV